MIAVIADIARDRKSKYKGTRLPLINTDHTDSEKSQDKAECLPRIFLPRIFLPRVFLAQIKADERGSAKAITFEGEKSFVRTP